MNTEKAFDMLPYVVDIYDKLGFDDYVKKIREQTKDKDVDQVQVGIDMFKFVLRNSNKVKKEFFEIVAIADDKKVEEVKNQSFGKTIESIKNIFQDDELVSFFKSAM